MDTNLYQSTFDAMMELNTRVAEVLDTKKLQLTHVMLVWGVCVCYQDDTNPTIKDILGTFSYLTKPTLTRYLQDLSPLLELKADEKDLRTKRVYLTPAGEILAKELKDLIDNATQDHPENPK